MFLIFVSRNRQTRPRALNWVTPALHHSSRPSVPEAPGETAAALCMTVIAFAIVAGFPSFNLAIDHGSHFRQELETLAGAYGLITVHKSNIMTGSPG